MPDPINSVSNPRIKSILKLQANSRERDERKLFVIEGYREISRAILSGIKIEELYICIALDKQGRSEEFLGIDAVKNIFEVGINAFSKIAYREGSDGLIGIAIAKEYSLDALKLSANPLILVLQSVEKPGNLGAIMRTADASAVDAVIVCDPLTDIYNPNAIRSSIGCLFSTQIVVCSTPEAILWLRKNGIRTFAAALTANAVPYYHADFIGSAAFIMGTESTGLSKEWLHQSDQHVIIPMKGIADSLNVSISAAILLFEAVRQRDKE